MSLHGRGLLSARVPGYGSADTSDPQDLEPGPPLLCRQRQTEFRRGIEDLPRFHKVRHQDKRRLSRSALGFRLWLGCRGDGRMGLCNAHRNGAHTALLDGTLRKSTEHWCGDRASRTTRPRQLLPTPHDRSRGSVHMHGEAGLPLASVLRLALQHVIHQHLQCRCSRSNTRGMPRT